MRNFDRRRFKIRHPFSNAKGGLEKRAWVMPFTAPQSLTPDEVYSLVAWLLHQNDILSKDAVMDARALPAVRMPNRNGFISDSRPDVPGR